MDADAIRISALLVRQGRACGTSRDAISGTIARVTNPQTNRTSANVVVLGLAIASCGPFNGSRVFSRDQSGVDTARLAEPVASRVGTADQGAVTIPQVYRWSPVDGRALQVWIACRGAGMSRACAVAVGVLDARQLQLLAVEQTGWALPTVSDGPDRAQLMAQGDEGRGTWRQMFAYDRDSGRVSFSRRVYSEGP